MCFSHWEKNGTRKKKNVRDIEGRSKNKQMNERK